MDAVVESVLETKMRPTWTQMLFTGGTYSSAAANVGKASATCGRHVVGWAAELRWAGPM